MSRSQLWWRCRRGMRELDIALMRYLELNYDAAGQVEKKSFETLLSWQDPEILDLLTGRLVVDDADLHHVIERILANSRAADH